MLPTSKASATGKHINLNIDATNAVARCRKNEKNGNTKTEKCANASARTEANANIYKFNYGQKVCQSAKICIERAARTFIVLLIRLSPV